MQKQAPTFGRLLTMALFALSCFGLLLFLWLSFGGSVPLRPEGYRVEIAFPEATQLGEYADVRMAGVSVGKVRKKRLDPEGNRTIAVIEFDRRAAPLRSDAKAILRQKTLLGETYVELTPGTKRAKPVPEDGRLANVQVQDSVQLDEIFRAFDPETRRSFRDWQQAMATSIEGRGRDLNDAFGTFPAFAADATDVLEVLDGQESAVQRLFKNTGVVFDALSENQQALRGLITNSDAVFSATQQEQDALADTFAIFPTFLDESRATMRKLETFSRDTRPLVRDLRPAMRDLKVSLRDVRAFAPDLRTTFRNLDPLITVSKEGLPALRDTLQGTGPLLEQLTPFLGELNPILEWLEHNQHQVADFITNGAGGLVDTTVLTKEAYDGGELGHYLRQIGPAGPESAAMYRTRPSTNRGNSYISGTQLTGPNRAKYNISPSTNCDNSGGEFKRGEEPPTDAPGGRGPSCFRETLPGAPGPGLIPQIKARNYLQPTPPSVRGK
jgi:phospholipid/cholesterol/gamma-HCH transport system substrate-binding protein